MFLSESSPVRLKRFQRRVSAVPPEGLRAGASPASATACSQPLASTVIAMEHLLRTCLVSPAPARPAKAASEPVSAPHAQRTPTSKILGDVRTPAYDQDAIPAFFTRRREPPALGVDARPLPGRNHN